MSCDCESTIEWGLGVCWNFKYVPRGTWASDSNHCKPHSACKLLFLHCRQNKPTKRNEWKRITDSSTIEFAIRKLFIEMWVLLNVLHCIALHRTVLSCTELQCTAQIGGVLHRVLCELLDKLMKCVLKFFDSLRYARFSERSCLALPLSCNYCTTPLEMVSMNVEEKLSFFLSLFLQTIFLQCCVWWTCSLRENDCPFRQ